LDTAAWAALEKRRKGVEAGITPLDGGNVSTLILA